MSNRERMKRAALSLPIVAALLLISAGVSDVTTEGDPSACCRPRVVVADKWR